MRIAKHDESGMTTAELLGNAALGVLALVVIWGLLRRGIDPSINALATLILFSLIALVVASNRLDRRRSRRQAT